MQLLSDNLRAFYLVATSGSTHAAAPHLNITQTAVTRRIASLEEELKTTLFIRSRRGMHLTEAGETLRRFCLSWLEQEGEILSGVLGTSSTAKVHLVVQGPSSVLRGRLIPQLTPLLPKFPELTFEFQIRDISSGVSALKSGDTHLAVIERRHVVKEFDTKLLRPEKYLLVGPASWRRRDLAEIVATERIIDFDPNDEMTLRFLRKIKLKPADRPRHFVNNTDALADMVERGLGYSVLAADFVKPWLTEKRLIDLCPGQHLDFDIALAWYPRPQMAPSFRAAVKAIV